MPTELSDNPLVNLLVKLERVKRERKRTIAKTAARRLLEDPSIVADFLRLHLPDPADAKHLPPEQRKLDETQRSLIEQVASGKLTSDSPEIRQYEALFALLITIEYQVESQVDNELRQAEREDFVERGGSSADWQQQQPFGEYVFQCVKTKLGEKLRGRLLAFILAVVEGRAAKHDKVGRELGRFVSTGWADELFLDLWEEYQIHSVQFGVPNPVDGLAESIDDKTAGTKEVAPSPDFRSVPWGGTIYSFTKTQAVIVGILWNAWKGGAPDVGTGTLLESVGVEKSRLPDIFRNNQAWGTMIVDGDTKGSKRMADPPTP